MRNLENPFKFGTIVEENYFTDRVEEVAYIEQFMKSANHSEFATSHVCIRPVSQTVERVL